MFWCKNLSEPDYPYPKRPNEPVEDTFEAPPPMPPPEPPTPPSPPFSNTAPTKFTCQICGKVFNTKEELVMHMETVHQSPKKKV
jgi:hypothetical protein